MSGDLDFDQVVNAAGVTDRAGFGADLRATCGIDPAQARFRPVRLNLDRAAGWVCDPEAYLEDGDEDGYELVMDLAEAYTQGNRVPPVVFGWWGCDPSGLHIIDGLHRLSGARAAGLVEVPAYEAHSDELSSEPGAEPRS